MIALWMLYALSIGALVALSAHFGERLLRLWRLPVRSVWAVGMLLTVAIPLLARYEPPPIASSIVASADRGIAVQEKGRVPANVELGIGDRARATVTAMAQELRYRAGRLASVAAPFDGMLTTAWLLASFLLACLLARSALRLRRRSRVWRRTTVDGVEVLVAPDAGPAVMGSGRASVVLPSWMLDLDQSLRRMVLRHELEHIRAGDPLLLLIGIAVAIAMPWNFALWWQLRRLRTAVELDCDRRVLQVHRDVERYGLLLLAVGQRAGVPLRLGAPALAESTGSLEQRIAVMTAPRTRRRQAVIRALLFAPSAAALGAAACMMPSPNAVAGPEPVPPVEQRSAAILQPSQVHFEFQVEKPVEQIDGGAPRYPAELRAQGVSGTVIAQFVVDTTGVPETSSFKVLESSHELFSDAVRDALPAMRFIAAEVRGQRVRQLVQQPFLFRIDGGMLLPARAPSGELTPLMRDGQRSPVPTRAPSGEFTPLMRDDQRAPAPTRAPDLPGRVPLRTGELRPAMRAPAASPARQRAYFEFEVEKPVAALPGAAPRYPAEMHSQGIRGEVIAEFVVDTDGRPDPATFRVLRSTHDAFANAARNALATIRFSPAQIAGRNVPQVVQMPFVFEVQ